MDNTQLAVGGKRTAERQKLHRITLAMILAGIAFAHGGQAAEELPRSPMQPTLDDCRQLFDAYRKINRQLERATLDCFAGPAHIGPGRDVGWPRCYARQTIRAWPQCFPTELETCETAKRADDEYQLCLRRAQVRDAAQVGAQRLNDAYGQYKKLGLTFGIATGIVTDPKKTIFDVLNKVGNKALAETLFNADGRLRDEHVADANQVYKLIFNVTRQANTAASSGVVRSIQAAAFTELKHYFDHTMADLDAVVRSMDTFKIDNAAGGVIIWPTNQALQPDQQSPGGRRTATPDCHVLREPEASRGLQERDEAAWLDLVGRCSK